jgi:hypothetical protein
MLRKWKPVIVENVMIEKFDIKVYEQVLYEVAKIIYSDICQLSKDSISDSLYLKNNFLQRTRTDA